MKMSEPKFRILLTILVSAIIIGSVFLISLNSNTDLHLSPQTVSVSTSGSSGLQLVLKTSGSRVQYGKNITISLEVYNPGFSSVNASANSNIWRNYSKMGFSTGPCGNKPYGILIARGNYSLYNMGSVTALPFYSPGIYFCPVFSDVNYYNFSPHSSKATMSGPNDSVLNGEITSFDFQLNISGYWTGSNNSNAQFHNYSPGIYTVFGSDGWGQISILHFKVE
jgi:hypothetical protein